jgi:hypothetical protein
MEIAIDAARYLRVLRRLDGAQQQRGHLRVRVGAVRPRRLPSMHSRQGQWTFSF